MPLSGSVERRWGNCEGTLHYPARLECSSLVSAAGGGAVAGLAPAGRNTMLSFLLAGWSSFIFMLQLVFLGAAVLSQEWGWCSNAFSSSLAVIYKARFSEALHDVSPLHSPFFYSQENA